MEKKIPFLNIALVYAIPILIFSLTFYLLLGGYLSKQPELAIYLTLDLMITAPFLYFLAIRKTNIPKFTVVSIFVIGTLIVAHALPHDAYPILEYIEIIFLPFLEIGIVSYLFYFIYKKRNEILSTKNSDDYLYLINESVEESLGKNIYAKLFATEIAFVFYALFYWEKKIPKENEYTYHLKNGLTATLACIGGVLVIEAFAMHLLIEKWSIILAWILTLGSLYAIFQITAHLKACKRRLITLENDGLVLRYGLFGDVKIPYSQIDSLEITRKTPNEKEGIVQLALVAGLEMHNVILHLNETVTIISAYGLRKKGNRILFHVDEKDSFEKDLNFHLTK